MAQFSLSPATQTVAVSSPATINLTTNADTPYSSGIFNDDGFGGVFSPPTISPGSSDFSFTYTNSTPGTYTITVALSGSWGFHNATVTVIVGSSTYTCTDTSTMLPVGFQSGDFSHKLTFPIPSPSSGRWWGGTLELKFTIDAVFAPSTPPVPHYLGIDVKHADNTANIGAFFMETGGTPTLKFPVADNLTNFDVTATITDQFLDACTFGSGSNLVVTIDATSLVSFSGGHAVLRHVTITQATLCLRNIAESAIAGSDGAPVAVAHAYPPKCNANNTQGASGAFSSTSLSGVKYQVVSGAAVDLADLWDHIQKPADVTTYEADGVLRHITVTIPVPPNFMPFLWISCTLNLKGTYTPDHTYGQLETTNDYPLYQFMVRGWSDRLDRFGNFSDLQNAANELTGESDIFDGRYASDFSTNGVNVYLGPISLFNSLASSNPDGVGLGGAFKFYIMARHFASDGIHTGDALLEWGSFDFTAADFTFQYCNVGSWGSYDATKTHDFGPVFTSPLPAPTDQIGSLVAHFQYSTVTWTSVPLGLPDMVVGPIESWVSNPSPSTVYPGYHTYSVSRGAGDTNGHVMQFPWGNRPSAVIVGGTLYNWSLKSTALSSLTESYCGCTGPVLNPFNLQDSSGKYHEVGLSGKAVAYRRSNFGSNADVGWDVQSQIAPPPGRQLFDPRIDFDQRQTVVIVYSQQVVAGGAWDGVYLVRSDDDGATWGAATLAIANGKHPTVAIGHGDATFERVVVAAYVGPGGGPGVITARFQDAGDTDLSDPFNFKDDGGSDMVAADDTFQIQQAHDNQARWMLHVRINGASATSTWTSMDDCRTWKQVA